MKPSIHTLLNTTISAVWFVNGLYCKVLNFVPRHHAIVAKILGPDHSSAITIGIGILEILMGVWILSRIKSRLCSIVQIVVVAVMNILEFFLAPELLLFGRFNILWATLFILIVFMNEFIFGSRLKIIRLE